VTDEHDTNVGLQSGISIDRGDSHFGDAGGWVEACYHIGVFLHWAARRGLASPAHTGQLERIAAAPGAYLVRVCDAKLLANDFTASESLIRALYGEFLPYYGRLVQEAMGTEYVLGLDPELLAKIDRTLDRALLRVAPERAAPPTPAVVIATPTVPQATPQRVRHPKFGIGQLLETSTEGGTAKVTVEFESVGRKVLLARFVDSIDSEPSPSPP